MDDLLRLLERAEVLGKLPDEARRELTKLAVRRDILRGEFLCRQGYVWTYALFIASGRMRWTMLSAGGQEHTLLVVEPSSVFWAHSFFDDEPMPASLAAVKDSVVYVWHRDAILPILYRHPESLWEINRTLVRTMRRAREIIYGLAFQPVTGRIANVLLNESGDSKIVERDWRLDELATMVASTPEVVCRVLHQFADAGLLSITRTRITLHNRDGLEKLIKMN
ncbi:MAG: Crp/Fnr family transcriptional regulator [Chloroflexi bacterium]|nr:Crp/Fnr family transcriptional regulator [Chloroflexota bacterium]